MQLSNYGSPEGTHMTLRRKKLSREAGRDEWLSAYEAAKVAGMSRLALYERALSGEVESAKVAGRRVFKREQVERLTATVAA